MKCPCCGREFDIGEELLYRIEEVYQCPHCWVKITGWRAKEWEAEGQSEEVQPAKVESAGPNRRDPATARRVDEKSVV